MPGTMTPLIEYLLGYERPEGGKLVRYGLVQTVIPIFPPATSVTWIVTPEFNSFANIEFYHVLSPSMVPMAFHFSSRHSGMELQVGPVSSGGLAEGRNTWIEITESDPIITTVTNISGVNQYLEAGDFFLIVDKEPDFYLVKQVIRTFGGG